MEIKIVSEHQGTSGDCIGHYICHFQNNPTLAEFIDWILTKRNNEWGYIEVGEHHLSCLEYKKGNIVSSAFNEEDLSKTINLLRMDGGWTRMDYVIDFE